MAPTRPAMLSTPSRTSAPIRCANALVIGPAGAGKSVLLAMMALQFRRYENNQIFAFDFGGSIRAAMLAMDGDWHNLGGNASSGQGPEDPLALLTLADLSDDVDA